MPALLKLFNPRLQSSSELPESIKVLLHDGKPVRLGLAVNEPLAAQADEQGERAGRDSLRLRQRAGADQVLLAESPIYLLPPHPSWDSVTHR